MKIQHHTLISLGLGLALFAGFRSSALAVSAFLSGIFIDLDHVFDYVREHGFRPDIRHFFHVFYKTLFRKIMIPLHSWELAILLPLIAAALSWEPVITGVAVGVIVHMVFDQLFNEAGRWSYFLAYRIACGFKTGRIFKGKGLE